MIRLLTHSGFTEPSSGVQLEGLAIRGSAKIKVQVQEGYVLKKLSASLYRTSKDWPNAHIQIQLNDLVPYRLRIEDIGQKEISIDLPSKMHAGDIEITFSIFPQGIFKFFNNFPFTKWKSLVRDSILLKKLYLDETKILNYHDRNRFAYGSSLQQIEIPVRILGFFGQTFGLAEAARRTYASLEKTGLLVKATQIPYSGKHHGSDNTVKADKKIPTNPDEIRIFHFNGDHFDKLISDWGESILDCKYKIGFWHWELPEFPDDYSSWFDMVDEIWVPSRFVFDAIAPKSPIPVQIIPLALDDTVLNPPPPDRKSFNIPRDKIIFLITFDFYSTMERKNPIASIQAFSKLMDDEKISDKIHLVIKVSNQHAGQEDFKQLLKTLTKIDKKKITFVNHVLNRHDMLVLMNSCDSLISTHRSEGFGLHPAEAMAMGKLVIATNWSGNTEFMNVYNSSLVNYYKIKIEDDIGPYRKNNVWANPSIENCIELMKDFVSKMNSGETVINDNVVNNIKELLSSSLIGGLIYKRILHIIRYIDGKST